MNDGFILLYKKAITLDEWKHPLRTLAWIDLLTLVEWQDKEVNGREVKRGELIVSETFLANRWHQHRGTVHRWLDNWERKQMVKRLEKQSGKQSPQRISIVNYAKYQDMWKQVGKQSPKHVMKQQGKQIERSIKENKKELKEYIVSESTQNLFDLINELCVKYNFDNNVEIKSLDMLVERYTSKIHMKVELQHCFVWLCEKKLKAISASRIGNWFKKAHEIQKKNQLKQLEWKEAQINPLMKEKKKEMSRIGFRTCKQCETQYNCNDDYDSTICPSCGSC